MIVHSGVIESQRSLVTVARLVLCLATGREIDCRLSPAAREWLKTRC
jgi:hypothetical protein